MSVVGIVLMVLWVAAAAAVLVWLALTVRATKSRPVAPAVDTGPLAGLDYQVRRAIECGESDAMLIKYAENVAYREWNATHPRDENTAFLHQLPAWTGTRPAVVSIPHVTATTPKVTYAFDPACPDCEFETLTMFGGEVAIPVRTVVCPKHQERL